MGFDATARRRWFGGVALGSALAMLICGQTILHDRLKEFTFIFYWLICFGLVGLAAIVAVRDLRELQRRAHQQERDLLETTLKEIEREARNRKQPIGHKQGR